MSTAHGPDLVNRPPHYTSHPSGIECIQVTEHMNFNLGNVIKYCWRAGEKGEHLEDLRKALWYLTREIKRVEGPPIKPLSMTRAEERWDTLKGIDVVTDRNDCACYEGERCRGLDKPGCKVARQASDKPMCPCGIYCYKKLNPVDGMRYRCKSDQASNRKVDDPH